MTDNSDRYGQEFHSKAKDQLNTLSDWWKPQPQIVYGYSGNGKRGHKL